MLHTTKQLLLFVVLRYFLLVFTQLYMQVFVCKAKDQSLTFDSCQEPDNGTSKCVNMSLKQ